MRVRQDGAFPPEGFPLLVLAVLFCLVLAALAVFQVLLIAGLPLGEYAWGGQQRVLPQKLRVGSAVSTVLYVLFALVALATAQVFDVLPGTPVVEVAMWVIAVYLLLGVVLNAVSKSRKERRVMVPASLVLGALALVLAIL
jgi:hypothetical protein